MFTVVVVLPTPPFWLATTITRVACGPGQRRAHPRALPGQHGVLGGAGQRRGVVVVRTAEASPTSSAPSARRIRVSDAVSRETTGSLRRPRSPSLWMNWLILWITALSRPSRDRWITRLTRIDGAGRPAEPGRVGLARDGTVVRPPLHRAVAAPMPRSTADGRQPIADGSAHATRTTRRWRLTPAPSVSTSAGAQPQPAQRVAAAVDLVARPSDPFIATSAPVGATSGIDQASSRPSGATAREVTTSKRSLPCSSSARPRTTSTCSEPERRRRPRRGRWSAAAAARPGSPAGPGRAIASTRPGSPAPVPMSHDASRPAGSPRPAPRS